MTEHLEAREIEKGLEIFNEQLKACKMLILIVDYVHTESAYAAMRNIHVARPITMLARGSAKATWLEKLGLEESEKAVIFGIIRQERVYYALKLLEHLFQLNQEGSGIAFTLPLNAHLGVKTLFRMMEKYHAEHSTHSLDKMHKKAIAIKIRKAIQYSEEAMKDTQQNTPGEAKQEIDYKLIITIVNRGFSSDVIDAAREAGAKGATTLHGRGLGTRDVEMFFNIRVEPEKDIVLILVEKPITVAVMETIAERCHFTKPGHGISFALGVDEAIGLTPMMKNME